jgi:Holliday junction resolvasome RuvABC DNA-binding subunit
LSDYRICQKAGHAIILIQNQEIHSQRNGIGYWMKQKATSFASSTNLQFTKLIAHFHQRTLLVHIFELEKMKMMQENINWFFPIVWS